MHGRSVKLALIRLLLPAVVVSGVINAVGLGALALGVRATNPAIVRMVDPTIVNMVVFGAVGGSLGLLVATGIAAFILERSLEIISLETFSQVPAGAGSRPRHGDASSCSNH